MNKNKKNKKIINILLLLIIVGLGAYLVSKDMDKNNLAINNSSGQIEYLEGNVEKKSNDGVWKIIKKGEIIENGDEIRTLDNSRVILTFEDGSLLRLDENTSTKIESLENNIQIDLNQGTIFNNVSKNKEREYSVKSDDFSIVALGTAFSVTNDNNSVDVLVLESSVEVRDKDGKNIEKVKTGEKVKIEDKKINKSDIKNSDLDKDFISWAMKESNIDLDISDGDSNTDPKPDQVINKISLSANKISDGIKLSWDTNGVGITKGFKVVMSESKNPTYPIREGDHYKYLQDSNKRSFIWSIKDGKTYYFRVCQYLGGKCGIYSNNVKITVPVGSSNNDYATSVDLSVTGEAGKAKLTWNISGGNAPHGFKVIMSENANPEYPTREGDHYQYLQDNDIRSYTWSGLESSKDYHFRVCIYNGNGSCVKYSNDVSVTLEEASPDEYATSVTLFTTYGENSVDLIWNIDGGGAPKGYKVVMSENANPEYPTREGDFYHYIDNENTKNYTWSNLEANKTYHFRVCIYKGGSCGVYSDDISVSL